ncbi:MAG: glycosyltransferase [Candidatus Omnitrophica bacterium]|nr:glycosyltransferase [Candidatus Omnitrophota bacterium]
MDNISLGIMAYNESGNIGRLLEAVLKQEIFCAKLTEIIVVSSGSTDATDNIVRSFMQKDKRISLIVQAQRMGKASAINEFLGKAKGEIIVLESADTLPAKGTLEKLVAVFNDPQVGMAGAHPVPVNPDNTFLGFAAKFIWAKHHQVAMVTPKMGELVAFRNYVRSIPTHTAVDEASIEVIVKQNSGRIVYVPYAIVYNKGAETISDFIKQRRRIFAGHKYLLKTEKYKVSTHNPAKIMLQLIARKENWWNFKKNIWTCAVIILELFCRFLGYYDYLICKKDHSVWEMASSTKKWE